MAKAAAPYLHPSLQAVEHSAKDEQAYPRSIKVVFVDSPSDSEQTKIRPETVSKIIPAFRVGKRDSVNTHRYNFCLIQRSLRMTPAMAAGIIDHIWHLKDIIS